MITIDDKKNCSGCSACANICPVRAINMQPDNEGFLYPSIDVTKCIKCNLCERICPYKSEWEPCEDKKEGYVGYNLNLEERETSSSGGIFVLLAKYILEKGGVVFGAAYDDDYGVIHKRICSKNDLVKLKGSKYSQSKISYIFTSVKEDLEAGKDVLFVGTTCQIAGLRKYLGEEYSKLYLVDFICLGVPSPKVWQDYINSFFHNEKILHVNFKGKERGWHAFSLNITTNNQQFSEDGKKNYFFSGYFKGLYLRPSCSKCQFKDHKNRVSDITLSDSWGCEHFAPELDDNRGLSNIIIHTDKGENLFRLIEKSVKYKEVSFDELIKWNKNYYYSLPYGVKRSGFWADYDRIDKKTLFRKYCFSSYGIRKIYRNIKTGLKKIWGK